MLDAHRVVRLCLVVDELAEIAEAYDRNEARSVRTTITADEFAAIGQSHAKRTDRFSFYRQLVLATRDARHILCSRDHPFDEKAFGEANRVYEFYPTTDELPSRGAGAGRRIRRVLNEFRRIARCGLHTTRAQKMCSDELRLEVLFVRQELRHVLLTQELDAIASPDAADDEETDSTDDEDVSRCDDVTDDEGDFSEDGELVD